MNNLNNSHCRLCAELKPNNKLINLQSDDMKRQEIVEKLTRVNATMDLNDNILPETVCFVCINTLNKAFEFVIEVEKAQVTLNDIKLMQRIKKEETESDNDQLDYEFSDVKYDEDVDVKSESDKGGSDSKSDIHVPIEITSKDLNKQSKQLKNSSGWDLIPLAQLKLTWSEYSWMCSYCETQFPTIDELQTHSLQYHSCCNAYRCTDCNIRKLRLDSFLIHVKRHRKYLKLSCHKCFLRFSSPHEVKRHKSVHIEHDYLCPGCNNTFSSSEEYEKHTNSFYQDTKARKIPKIQKPEGSLTCTLCEKSFAHKGSLSTHLLIHTERTRDHTCEKCGKCFLSKNHLAGHMLLHEEVRPYQCEICKSSFKTNSHLRNHVGVHDGHKPFACHQCGRSFRLQKHLSSHSVVHTDTLPYVCTFCNKGFRFKTLLNQHIRQHTGVKPYSCTICQRDFTNWPNYNKHMKRRHSMDMSKKKHTPNGVYPIDPNTGEVIIHPETNKTLEWKKKMMVPRKPGRPKLVKKCQKTEEICKDNSTELLSDRLSDH